MMQGLRITRNLKQLWEDFLSLFFPAICWGCQQVLREEGILCDTCRTTLPFWDTTTHDLCKRFPPKTFAESTAIFMFDKGSVVQRLIHAFKYSKRLYVGEELARIGSAHAEKTMSLHSCQLIVPVPLHWRRRWWRGFNQSEIIARSFSTHLGIPLGKHVLTRTAYTKSQVGKGSAERRQGMHDKFAVKLPERIKGRCVLLVDDVVTTGSTVLDCARALKVAGAKEVLLCTLAATVE